MAALTIAQRIFRVRSFKGASPATLRRRFQLATGLIKDVRKGRISVKTALLLAEEAYDRILRGGPLTGPLGGSRRSHHAMLSGRAVRGYNATRKRGRI